MTIEVTDRMIGTLGRRLARLMRESNAPNGPSVAAADYRLDGILYTLSILDIPHKEHWNGEEDRYTAAEIAGKMFYVGDDTAEQETHPV